MQKMGAQAILIASDENQSVDNREKHQSDSKYDGLGHLVDIPTLIIDKEHGQKLLSIYKEASNKHQQLVLNAHIDVIEKDKETISYTLFYGSILDLDPKELYQLAQY